MEKEFEFRLNINDLNAVLEALAEKPFKVAQPVIQKIIEQHQAQTKETAPE